MVAICQHFIKKNSSSITPLICDKSFVLNSSDMLEKVSNKLSWAGPSSANVEFSGALLLLNYVIVHLNFWETSSLQWIEISLTRMKFSLRRVKFSLKRTKFSLKRTKFSLKRTKFSLKRTKFSLKRTKFSLKRIFFS